MKDRGRVEERERESESERGVSEMNRIRDAGRGRGRVTERSIGRGSRVWPSGGGG